MDKLWLIVKREYLVRVKKKSFIITTLLTPIGIGLLIILSAFLAAKGGQSSKRVLVKDDTEIFSKSNPESKLFSYDFSKAPLERLKEDYKEQEYDLLVHIPEFAELTETKHTINYYSQEKLSMSVIEGIEYKVGAAFKEYKIAQSGIDRDVYDSFKMDINMENAAANESPEDGKKSGEDTSSKLSIIIGTILGGIMGFIMYLVIFIYGSMVMRSVLEEKINRIVEVIISSVRPTQLMLGKVLGVGGVGLTQLAIWLVLIPMVTIGAGLIVGGSADPAALQEMSNQAANMPTQDLNDFEFGNIVRELSNMNWWLIVPVFVIFFFGGYFIYSSLFAAVGSAMGDDMGEGQQLMLPIMLPVILAFIMMQGTLQNPNGGMAIFGSLFPLTSPIIMPSRLAFDPPLWQVFASIIILIASCWFFAWLAGRIYRVGILMYGKKITFKEIGKWIMYKA